MNGNNGNESADSRVWRMCGSKHRFSSKKDAQTAANYALRRRHNRPEIARVYHCPNCNGFHLSHKPDGSKKYRHLQEG